jgi:hypothetical protein
LAIKAIFKGENNRVRRVCIIVKCNMQVFKVKQHQQTIIRGGGKKHNISLSADRIRHIFSNDMSTVEETKHENRIYFNVFNHYFQIPIEEK